MESECDIEFILGDVKKYLEEVLNAEKESRGARRDQWYDIAPQLHMIHCLEDFKDTTRAAFELSFTTLSRMELDNSRT